MFLPKNERLLKQAEKEIEIIENHFKKGFLSKEEKTSKVIEVWTRAKSKLKNWCPKPCRNGSVFLLLILEPEVPGLSRSDGRDEGLVINPAGQIIELPVKSSFKEGFDVLEYFISTHGARKGTADTALRTSTAGYLNQKIG